MLSRNISPKREESHESRMTTISYGLTRPLCGGESDSLKNKNDECMKSNRRVHFEVIVK